MPLPTTVIGSLPKPEYLKIPSCVENSKHTDSYMEEYRNMIESLEKDGMRNSFEGHLKEAVQDAVELQTKLGIDVITDGELARDSYVSYFCRLMDGFDLVKPGRKLTRNGAADVLTLRIISKLKPQSDTINSAIVKDFLRVRSMTSSPVKVNIPGPMTIKDTMLNCYYDDADELRADLITCINETIKAMVQQGCVHIQIDDPVLVRYPSEALEHGVSDVSKCFEGIPESVTKSVHICCGYPFYLDQVGYQKADQDAYLKIADALDNAGLDEISIEDAHRRNDPKLFSHFKKTKVILGVIDVARSRIETVEEIRDHIADVLQYIPKERLIISPDCGLIYLTRDMIEQKLRNMVAAARMF